MNYYDFTHYVPMWLLWLWKRVFCKRGWHAWDEVWSVERHYLVCDACEREVEIG